MSPTIPLDYSETTHALPQYGFGAVVDFDALVKTNRFLFRVYTPKEQSPFFDDTDPFFIAPRFDEKYNSSSEPLPDWKLLVTHSCTSSEVISHMDWTTRSSSSFISTSFSFMWSIWEALRRYHLGVKKDVQIAIIDTGAIQGRATTAVQELKKCPVKERRRREYWGWYRFAQESQLVLVYGAIPGTAVLSSIPLLSILKKLPSYFLQRDVEMIEDNPLSYIAWNYTQKRSSYRRFCQDMSNRFFSFPSEVRLRDTTAGSVRLAVSLLRPWFHRHLINDFDAARSAVCILALAIAQWPGQWWAHDHSELWDIIRCMTLTLAEELRDNSRSKVEEHTPEASQSYDVVNELESITDIYENKISSELVEKTCWTAPSDDMLSRSDSSPGPSKHLSDLSRPLFTPSMSLPDMCVTPKMFEIPLTPPASPRNSLSIPSSYVSQYQQYMPPLVFSLPSSPPELISEDESIHVPEAPIQNQASRLIPPVPPPSSPRQASLPIASPALHTVDGGDFTVAEIVPSANISLSTVDEVSLATPVTTPNSATPTSSPGPILLPLEVHVSETLGSTSFNVFKKPADRSEPSSPSDRSELHSPLDEFETASASIPSPITNPQTPLTEEDDLFIVAKEGNTLSLPSKPAPFPFLLPPRETSRLMTPLMSDDDDAEEQREKYEPTVAEAASCILTGFLVGAFITLCLLSPHRRALLYAT